MEKHQWKNRILLIFSDDKVDEKLQQQIINLSKDKKGLIERKLKIYQFVKDEFTTDFKTNWSSKTLKNQNYKKESESFKVILIGLDGGIKLKQNKVLTTEKLFTIIDGMPMRRRELKQKN